MRKKLFRALYLGLTVSLISFFATSSPALAQSITLSATSGPVGTAVSVTGSGFNANVNFQTYFAYGTTYQVAVAAGTISSTGTLNTSFGIPSVPAGTYTVRVQTSTSSAFASFTVTPAISLSAFSVIVGNQVGISGTGFSAGRTVTIRFDNTQVATTSTSSAGRFSASFTVPEAYTGSHTISATDGVYIRTATLSVVQSMTISPTSGSVGTTVTVSGTGFGASRSIRISYDGSNIATVPSSIITNNVGSFSAKFTVPAGTARTVQVVASDGTNLANTFFMLLATIGLTPTEGKVGTPVTILGSGFNANRQVAVAFDNEQVRQVGSDRFGSFTTSFIIPAASGGQHSVTANDGVRSVSVTFTVANNLVITPNSGKVGTPVDVSGSGFRDNRTVNVYFDNTLVLTTYSNTYGSFSATFDTIASTGGTHTISANDGAYTASSNFMVLPSVALSQTSGKMGTQVDITGTGFSAGQTLVIRLGTTLVRSTTTDANGSFSDRFTVPQLEAGNYNLNACDGVNMASVAFTVTASFSISPTSGYVGSVVTVNGGGYDGLVTIEYDDTVVANATANTEGFFSTTFIVPVSVHGFHTVIARDDAIVLQTTFSMESTPPPAPVVLAPTGLVRENARPTFVWEGANDPSGVKYNIQVASDANFDDIVMERKDLTTTQYTVSNTEKLPSNSKESPYYWRVMASDLASNQGNWSESGSFYVSLFDVWVRYTLIGVGSLILILFVFWLGLITGRKRRQAHRNTD